MLKAYYVEGMDENYRIPMVLAESPLKAAELFFKGWVDPTYLVEETETAAVYRYNLSCTFYDPKNPGVPLPEDWQHITFVETDDRIFIVNQDA